jgi:hypothetical protein
MTARFSRPQLPSHGYHPWHLGSVHTWSLEVNAPHFHGVFGVVGGEVGVVQQAFGAGLRVLAFTSGGARGTAQYRPV